MTQVRQTEMPLFDRVDAEQKKTRRMSRRGDPATSKEAARKHMKSGSRKANADKILDALREHFPSAFTAGEIPGLIRIDRIDRVEVGRRMSELAKEGMVGRHETRKCRVHDTTMIAWIYTGETSKETVR